MTRRRVDEWDAPHQHIRQSHGHLFSQRVVYLCPEVGQARHDGLAQRQLVDDALENSTVATAVAANEMVNHFRWTGHRGVMSTCIHQPSQFGQRHWIQRCLIGSTLLEAADAAASGQSGHHSIHDLLRHVTVGGQFASGDGNETCVALEDLVLAGDVVGILFLRVADERAHARPGADDVICCQTSIGEGQVGCL